MTNTTKLAGLVVRHYSLNKQTLKTNRYLSY